MQFLALPSPRFQGALDNTDSWHQKTGIGIKNEASQFSHFSGTTVCSSIKGVTTEQKFIIPLD